MSKIPEVIMHYNVKDNSFYIYLGEDYIDNTKNKELAMVIFFEECEKLRRNYD